MLNGTSETAAVHGFCASEGVAVRIGPRNATGTATRNATQNERGIYAAFPQRVAFGSTARGRDEQRREQRSRLCFFGSRQLLKPRRLEPDLIVIDRPAQRHQFAGAVRIRHSVVGAGGRPSHRIVAVDADSAR